MVDHFVSGLRRAPQDGNGILSTGAYTLVIDMFHAGQLSEMPGLLTGAYFNAAIIMNTTDDPSKGNLRTPDVARFDRPTDTRSHRTIKHVRFNEAWVKAGD